MKKILKEELERHLTSVMLDIWPEGYQNERREKLEKMKNVIQGLK